MATIGIEKALEHPQFWRDEDISHILLYRTGLDFILLANSPTDEPLPVPKVLDDLSKNHLELVFSIGGGAYELYKLPS